MTEESQSTELVLAKLENAQLLLEQKQKEFALYISEVKKHEENVKKLKEALYEKMTAEDVKKLETDHFTITRTKSYTKHSHDMKALAAMNPKLYEKVDTLVGKDTTVKGSIKITTKGGM